MSRRRYLSTQISTDTAVNKLAQTGGDFAALLYTWMIPHAADDATLPGDPEELLFMVMPGRRDKSTEDITAALKIMRKLGLIEWDGKTVTLPKDAFYKYQTYIPDGKRRGAQNSEDQRIPEDNSANQRKTPQNSAYPSPSFSPSPTPSPSPPENVPPVGGSAKPKTKSVKVPIPDNLVELIPPETWALIREEQKLTDDQLRFETALMIDHYQSKGERRPNWVAGWRTWMRHEYRQSKPIPPPEEDPTIAWMQNATVAPEHRLRMVGR